MPYKSFICESCKNVFWEYTTNTHGRFCSRKCINLRGKNNPNFKRGFYVGKNGYIYEQYPSHPLRDKKGRVLQHRRVVYDFLGHIPIGYSIHHIDENKLNNDISNLALISQSDHLKMHDPLSVRYKKRTKFKTKSIPIPAVSFLNKIS